MLKIENTNIDKELENVYLDRYYSRNVDCVYLSRNNLFHYYIEKVINKNPEPSRLSNDLFMLVVNKDFLDNIKYLCELPLSFGVNIAMNYDMIIRTAINQAHFEITKYLCELPTERGVTAEFIDEYQLKRIVESGNLELFKYLYELPNNRGINIEDIFEKLIRKAVNSKHLDIAKYILSLELVKNKLSKIEIDKHLAIIDDKAKQI